MATIKQKITACLWFDTQAEDAAKFYTSVFENSRIKTSGDENVPPGVTASRFANL